MPPHRDEPQHDRRPAAPPEPRGRVLARCRRRGFRGGPDVELVVALEELPESGATFVTLRLWEMGRNGALWPARGRPATTVRLSEVDQVVEALRAAQALARPPEQRGVYVERPADRRRSRLQGRPWKADEPMPPPGPPDEAERF